MNILQKNQVELACTFLFPFLRSRVTYQRVQNCGMRARGKKGKVFEV